MSAKLASIKPTRAQIVTATFTTINVVTNLVLICILVFGGISVHGVYTTVSTNVTPKTLRNAQMMFDDATFFVHQLRIKYEANNGNLPFNLTDVMVASTRAMDGVTAVMASVDRDAVSRATSRLGEAETQAFIADAIVKILDDVKNVQTYISTLSFLINRIQVNPLTTVPPKLGGS